MAEQERPPLSPRHGSQSRSPSEGFRTSNGVVAAANTIEEYMIFQDDVPERRAVQDQNIDVPRNTTDDLASAKKVEHHSQVVSPARVLKVDQQTRDVQLPLGSLSNKQSPPIASGIHQQLRTTAKDSMDPSRPDIFDAHRSVIMEADEFYNGGSQIASLADRSSNDASMLVAHVKGRVTSNGKEKAVSDPSEKNARDITSFSSNLAKKPNFTKSSTANAISMPTMRHLAHVDPQQFKTHEVASLVHHNTTTNDTTHKASALSITDSEPLPAQEGVVPPKLSSGGEIREHISMVPKSPDIIDLTLTDSYGSHDPGAQPQVGAANKHRTLEQRRTSNTPGTLALQIPPQPRIDGRVPNINIVEAYRANLRILDQPSNGYRSPYSTVKSSIYLQQNPHYRALIEKQLRGRSGVTQGHLSAKSAGLNPNLPQSQTPNQIPRGHFCSSTYEPRLNNIAQHTTSSQPQQHQSQGQAQFIHSRNPVHVTPNPYSPYGSTPAQGQLSSYFSNGPYAQPVRPLFRQSFEDSWSNQSHPSNIAKSTPTFSPKYPGADRVSRTAFPTHYPSDTSSAPVVSPIPTALVQSVADTLSQRSTFKSQYDSKTIVHDLQLVLGNHPNRPALNHQLLPLQTLFPEVNENSNLATFRWDLAFPNGLPARGLLEASKNTSTSILPTAMGSHYDSPSSLRTRPWSVVDPTPHRPSLLRHESTPGASSSGEVAVVVPSIAKNVQKTYNSTSAFTPELAFRTSARSEYSAPSSRQDGHPKSVSANPNTIVTPSKRGRPRRNSHLNTSSESEHPSTQGFAVLIPQKRGRPAQDADATPKNATNDGAPKKRGRPFKTSMLPSVLRQEPSYHPFLCEWKGCPCEMVNIEFLRRHIAAVHSRKQKLSGKYACMWAKCGLKSEIIKTVNGVDKAVTGLLFDDRMRFKKHVEREHILPVAWHMGDGPQVIDSDPKPLAPIESEPWLYDTKGTQVTPSVRNQQIYGGKAKDYHSKKFSSNRYSLMVLVQSPSKEKLAEYVEVEDDESEQGEDESIDAMDID